MYLVKQIEIDQLQPTDVILKLEKVLSFASTFPLLRDNSLPQIWEIDKKMYISDGHHRIHDLYRRERKTISAVCFTPENCGVGPEVYEEIVDYILEESRNAKEKGITHISDLEIAA